MAIVILLMGLFYSITLMYQVLHVENPATMFDFLEREGDMDPWLLFIRGVSTLIVFVALSTYGLV